MAARTIKRTYLYAVGRRKTAVARVRLYQGEPASIVVNEQPLEKYFSVPGLPKIAQLPLIATNQEAIGRFTIKTAGGGKFAQAEAVRLGISRLLVQVDPQLKEVLKRAGYLTRDPRRKERKKPGLKRARRAPQWSKR